MRTWIVAGSAVLVAGGLAWAHGAAPSPGGEGTTGPGDPAPDYDAWFTDEALRVDLTHGGTATEEVYAVDGLVREPLWPGVRGAALRDPLGYGEHRFRVTDAASGRLLFSQGYCTLFGEWQATGEALAGTFRRSFEEAVRFPFPRRPVVLHIDRRGDAPGPDGRGTFAEIFRLPIDPLDPAVRAELAYRQLPRIAAHESGDPRHRIDILVLGDGYTEGEMAKYRADLRRFTEVLFTQEAFARQRDRINVWGLETPSRDRGPDEPRKGMYRDTALGTTFNTFDSARYLTTSADRELRRIAANAPYDALYIMVNTSRYGGGGIYNLWSTFPSDNEYDDYVFSHEFGHSFAGLGDEYFDSSTGYDADFYPAGVEPWEPNLTALLPGRPPKWTTLLTPGVPIPTPDTAEYARSVGAFEGAGYKAKGLYRPFHDCRMFHKGIVGFCPVCTDAMERAIGLFAE